MGTNGIVVIVIVALLALARTERIVKQYEQGVLFRPRRPSTALHRVDTSSRPEPASTSEVPRCLRP